MRRLGAAILASIGAGSSAQGFRFWSPCFGDGDFMPDRCSSARRGKNASPSLAWDCPPEGTASFAIFAEDLDPPLPVKITHWIVYNIPAEARILEGGQSQGRRLPGGAAQGLNFHRRPGYLGPSPVPAGAVHRYRFTIFALDAMLPGERPLDRRNFLREAERHSLGSVGLIGRFGGRR
jgi:Raf kinase inhibitor-like YbhB/YbcL family protein